MRKLFAPFLAAAVTACVGTTGGDLVTFSAFASGPRDADPTRAFEFDTGRGWHVSLTRASLHVGAVYLNRATPSSGAQATSCVLPGIYVAQVTSGLDVDALSPTLQRFPMIAEGTSDHASTGEVWLTGGDVNALDDPTPILDVAGSASKDGKTLGFAGLLTIGTNRALAPLDKTQPGSNPICKQRIASPIPTDVTPRAGGALFVEIDPRGWFTNVDFAAIPVASDDPTLHRFTDSSDPSVDAPSRNLFLALHASVGVYSFHWGAAR